MVPEALPSVLNVHRRGILGMDPVTFEKPSTETIGCLQALPVWRLRL